MIIMKHNDNNWLIMLDKGAKQRKEIFFCCNPSKHLDNYPRYEDEAENLRTFRDKHVIDP